MKRLQAFWLVLFIFSAVGTARLADSGADIFTVGGFTVMLLSALFLIAVSDA